MTIIRSISATLMIDSPSGSGPCCLMIVPVNGARMLNASCRFSACSICLSKEFIRVLIISISSGFAPVDTTSSSERAMFRFCSFIWKSFKASSHASSAITPVRCRLSILATSFCWVSYSFSASTSLSLAAFISSSFSPER